jgi:hypothetical protein
MPFFYFFFFNEELKARKPRLSVLPFVSGGF